MAPQRVLKSLNKGPGKQRFVFKSFSQRVEDVDVDVFRSLAPVKFEPTSGSSFFHENLLRWRELNAAADFNSLYVELMPVVQTMPQLLLHKDAIMKALLSRVRMSAILSIEPILSLIALLSRDLREEFLPYMAKFLEVCSDLLKAGGDQEPDLMEQIFVSVSYVIKYLTKFLVKDMLFVLRVTKSLRYYHRTFVQDFVAESVSYLLRKAPSKQLIKGVRRLFGEVEADPSETSCSSCCTLLFHTLKGPAFGLHSQADALLHLLLDGSTLGGVQRKRYGVGENVAVRVVSKTFLMLCEHINREKLETLWVCLIEHITGSLEDGPTLSLPQANTDAMVQESATVVVKDVPQDDSHGLGPTSDDFKRTVQSLGDGGCPGPPKEMPEENEPVAENEKMHLVCLLSLLTDVLEFRKGSRVNDYKPLFALVPKLLQPEVLVAKQLAVVHSFAGPLAPARLFWDWASEFSSEVLRFLLALVKSHAKVAGASAGPGSITTVAPTWAVAFECNRVNCLFPFLRGLIEQDVIFVQIFAPEILRSLDLLIEDYPVEVLPLLLDMSQKRELGPLLSSTSEIKSLKSYVFRLIQQSIKRLENGSLQHVSSETDGLIETLAMDPAALWMALKCLPCVVGLGEEQASLAWNCALAVEHFLSFNEEVANCEKNEDFPTVWECLLATALSSHTEIHLRGDCGELWPLAQHVDKYLDLAVVHRQSSHVLKAVAELLDASSNDVALENASSRFRSILENLGPNLSGPKKSLRLATLRILAHYEALQTSGQKADKSPSKKRKGNAGQVVKAECSPSYELFQQLLAVESSVHSHENVRQSIMLITAVKVAACTSKIPDWCLVMSVNALIGVLHNRFSLLWDPVIEALAGMLEVHGNTVGQVLLSHLEVAQNSFLCQGLSERTDEVIEEEATQVDLWGRFHSFSNELVESTHVGNFFILQLRILQKVAKFAEARSRQLIPMFLTFVGHSDTEQENHQARLGGGKDWKAALKEWLNLIKEMRNARSLFRGVVVKEILLSRFLSDSDPAIQQVTLEVLLNWKDKYLTAHEEHLKNLISSKAVREELTTWDISKEGHLIQDEDREDLLNVVLLILFPKIMRRTMKSMGKSGVGVQRNAVLSFLARLESRELASLFCQLMKPLESIFTHGHPPDKSHQSSKVAWMSIIEGGASSEFIEQVDGTAIALLPHKRKLGFLHMVVDSLEIFNSTQLTPYLHALLVIVLRLLETCSSNFEDEGSVWARSNGVCDVDPSPESKASLLVDLHGTATVQGEKREDMAGSSLREETMLSICGNEIEVLPVLETVQQSASEPEDTILRNAGPDLNEEKEESPNLVHPSQGVEPGEVAIDGQFILSDEKPGQLEHELEEGSRLSDVPDFSTSKRKGGHVREIRTLSFRILATVMRKFENIVFPSLYWDIFFNAIRHSVSHFVAENSFNSTPGALMECFMSMSQRLDLAPLLARDPAVVPNILLILSVKGTSTGLVSAILQFVENILDLVTGSEGNEDMEAVQRVLIPHLDVLLSSFGKCLSFRRETGTEKRSLKRELRVLTRLSKYIEDTAGAAKLQDVLLPMLKVKKRMEPGLCLDVLRLVEGLGSILPMTSVINCLPVLAPLLVSVSNQDLRSAISETLMAFAKVDQTLLSVAETMVDLNSISSATVDEFDYCRRLLAYDRMSVPQFWQLTRAQALLALSQVIYDLGSEDMSLRHRASDCLQKYVQFAALMPDEDDVQEGAPSSQLECIADEPNGSSQLESDQILESLKAKDPSTTVSSENLKSLVPNFLLPHIRNAMGSDKLVVRREWVLLLREIAENFSHNPALTEYQCLISTDIEVDFFHNIVHLQIHRRIKAMGKFKAICSSSHFSQGGLSRIFVPLFMNSIFEASGDKEGNLVTVAVETLACIATQLRWEPYFSLLMRCFRLLAVKPDHQKVLVRLVCAILDSFHFFLPLPADQDERGEADSKDKGSDEVQEGSCRALPAVDILKGQPRGDGSLVARLPGEVLSLLQKRVLPEIRRLMVSKVGIVSTPVALTQVKILKLMPENIVEVELPQVIRTVVNALKSRSQAVRDEARAALVAITETLGANYLNFVIDVLQSSLTKGFELHVLGYTVNSILVKLVPKLKVGEIDYCLEQLLGILENDIMGEVAEEKNVEAIAVKMKETKHMRSFESIKLVAQVATFRTQALALLGPVRRNLQKATAPKVKPKLENMLLHVALGLQINTSVSQSDLLVIVYAMVEDGVKEEKAMACAAAAKKQARIDKLASVVTSTEDNLQAIKAPIPHFYLITEYALQLLQSHLKRIKVSPRDGDTLAMLNPLVRLLQGCLNSKYDGVLASALKIFSHLLLLPLPAIDLHGSKITSLVFSICQRFSKADNSLLQACLNVLIILIRQCKSLQLSENQLRTLLQFPIFTDMAGSSRLALSLLKAIVSRKLVVPELYDIMNRVAHLMVTSYLAPVRQLCSQIMLQFLLDYPLGEKRLQQHLDFFITNVGYAETSGREAALEMLHTVILKFPEAVVEEHTDGMFFPLVTRLVNDESNQVRAMIGTILKVLMGRVSSRSLQRMVDFAMAWFKGADARLWRTASQVLGLLIEVMGKSFGRYSQDVYPQCINILELADLQHEGEDLESNQTCKAVPWEDAYFSLTMMEKLLQQLPNAILLPDLKTFWMLVSSLLLHEHIWIRKVCGRMLSIYFAACGVPNSQRLEAAALGNEDILFFHPSWILLLTASFCQQLESGSIDDAMGEHLIKILEVLCSLLPMLPPGSAQEEFSYLGCNDVESQERVSRALHTLGWEDSSNKGAQILGENCDTSPVLGKEGNGQYTPKLMAEATGSSVLSLVFKKLQKIALRVHPIQTKVVFRWYSTMAPRLGTPDIEIYLQSMLIVLTKLTEGSAAKVVPDDLKGLGDEVLSQLRDLIGAAKFVDTYNAVREMVKENRDKRKQAQKISVLTHPEQNAKRKIKLAAKRQAQKKRRIIKGKVQMGL